MKLTDRQMQDFRRDTGEQCEIAWRNDDTGLRVFIGDFNSRQTPIVIITEIINRLMSYDKDETIDFNEYMRPQNSAGYKEQNYISPSPVGEVRTKSGFILKP